MSTIGYATLDVIPSVRGMRAELDKQIGGDISASGKKAGAEFGDAAGKTAGARFGSAFKTASRAALIGVAGLGVAAFKVAGDAISEASDLNESLNAVNVSYGRQARGVKRLGREAANALGLSNNEFNSLSVRFSSFAKTISGGDASKVVGTLDDLTTRASDFASVMNLEVTEAAELFQSGLAGETEPLRRFGLDLSAAAITAHAYKTGLAEAGAELTESQKIQARYSLLMAQTSKTQGDFANTSDSLANRQRILSARWDNAQAKLGKGLLPVMERFVGFVLDKGVPAVERFSDWFNDEGIPAFDRFSRFTENEILPVLSDIGSYADDAAAFVGDLVGFLNDLPKGAKIAALTTALGGGAALKLRGGSTGALGTAGKVLGLAKPVPVFVTNKGALGGSIDPDDVSGSKWSKFGKTFGNAAGAAAIVYLGYEAAKNFKRTVDDVEQTYRPPSTVGIFPGGGESKPITPFTRQDAEDTYKLRFLIDSGDGKTVGVDKFADQLDLVGKKKINPQFSAPGLKDVNANMQQFLAAQLEAKKPITPFINTSSIERALTLINALTDGMHGVPTAGSDGGTPFLSGAGSRAGVSFNGPITVNANDPREMARELDKKTRNRALGGRG